MADVTEPEGTITLEELQLATRNHGMPLEALRWPVTPVGLHYVLVHYDIPHVDAGTWSLEIGGRVTKPLRLTLDDLAARPRHTVVTTMECAGNGRALLEPRPVSQPWLVEAVGTATWTGTPLAPLLEAAGLADDAREILFAGLDRGVEGDVPQRFERSLPVDECLGEDVILAYEMNGEPLPPQHGFPLRLVVPGWYGMTNVKWLTSISVTAEPFDGYQQATAYRLRQQADEPGEPLTRMLPRALMVPPGVPEFMTRRRFLRVGRHTIDGRAWSGWGDVEAVDVSADGGEHWQPAEIEAGADGSRWAWRRWHWVWEAEQPGEYILCCRARDAAGNVQPEGERWNFHGYANNAVQRLPVTVQS
ncbi:MAG TPA: sulfite oxidase [Acidimicrobiia bacterium]|nr:sulfite oxidase [Acidimicrobiia bacterium]